MKFEHLIIGLLMPFGLLLIAGGAAFQHFQYWAMSSSTTQNQARETVHYVQNAQPTSLRVVSSHAKNSYQPEAHYHYQPPNETVQAATRPGEEEPVNQSQPLAAAASSSQQNVPTQVAAKQTEDERHKVQPLLAVYPDFLLLELPAELVSEQKVKRALARVMLSPNPHQETDLLSLTPIHYQTRPAYYRQILNQYGKPIRYPREAFVYAEYLMASFARQIAQASAALAIRIPLQASNLKEPARRFEPWVFQFARDFNVSPALVFAVMEVESHFDPMAVSKSNAKGLMQIKSNAAGRDVYQYIDFKLGAPGDKELFDAPTNIRMGTAYLSLLKYDYLAEINNSDIREMVAISSYNGGISTVLRLFAAQPEEAIARINRLNKSQVYRVLRYDHPSDETRRYLDKVLKAKARYQDLLGDDAQLLASRDS